MRSIRDSAIGPPSPALRGGPPSVKALRRLPLTIDGVRVQQPTRHDATNIDAAKQLRDVKTNMRKTQTLAGGKFTVEMEVFGSGEPLLYLHGFSGLMAE